MGKHIVLGVSGSIAAFKAAKLASDLVKEGYDVRVCLTRGGAQFITPLTFEALTGNRVATEAWDEQPGESRMAHLELGAWADLIVVAPASANVLARLALGLADDMLTSAALATHAMLVLAPAMESGMWLHAATQQHVHTLQARGATFVGPDTGHLASGTSGAGRMAEPEVIVREIQSQLQASTELEGVRVLVTAGPTVEPIDPVRYIGNRSSGKMGVAIAREARNRGAQVALIRGRSTVADPPGVQVRAVETSAEMRDAVLDQVAGADVVVMAAAIGDYRPASVASGKLKRQARLALELVPTEDIAAQAAAAVPSAVHVGFALETENLVSSARDKLRRKGQDLVVANALTEGRDPMGSDVNRVVLVTENEAEELPEMSKQEVAGVLWDRIAALLERRGLLPGGRARGRPGT